MPDDQELKIDVYLAGTNTFDGTAAGIRIRVHPGADPDDPDSGPSCKASNAVQVFKAEPIIEFALRLGGAVRLKAGKAVRRGRDAMSRRNRRG